MARDFKNGVKTTTLQVTGGSPASGNVLTSDASGNATWQAAGGGSSPTTTKGDLAGYNTASARVPVGTDGTLLAADSGQTLGLGYQDISFQNRRNQQASINPGATTVSTFGMAAAPTVTSGVAATNADGVDGPMLNISTTTTSGNVASIASAATQLRRDWDFDLSFRVRTPTGGVTGYRYWVGAFSGSPAASDTPSVHIAGFRFVSTGVAGHADWRGITAAGSATETEVATSVNVAASTVYNLRIVCSGSAVNFYVNGKYIGQSTTNLPTSTQLMGWGVYCTTLSAVNSVIQWGWTSIMSK